MPNSGLQVSQLFSNKMGKFCPNHSLIELQWLLTEPGCEWKGKSASIGKRYKAGRNWSPFLQPCLYWLRTRRVKPGFISPNPLPLNFLVETGSIRTAFIRMYTSSAQWYTKPISFFVLQRSKSPFSSVYGVEKRYVRYGTFVLWGFHSSFFSSMHNIRSKKGNSEHL